ncbi:MAG: PLP-dependent aspartate aminotransferase family protein [Firmicutes bacterium]|nr:PLP-dependent aspartate aminotransferase family protein [Bacillota bacterium]
MKISTKCLHGFRYQSAEGAVATPIFQSATFAHPAIGQSTGYDYSRLQNPTRETVENLLASLENAAEALAFSTGMAALTTLMELFSPDDHIIATSDLYGGSIRLFQHISQKNGLQIDFVDTSNIAATQNLIKPNTRAIFVETPTNPMMNVTDISAIKNIVKGQNILLIVDNTFLTPYFQQPLLLGADIVLHSGTKYLSGHNDTLAGFLAVSEPQLCERLKFIHKTTGACLSPFDSFLVIRGIKTLGLRMDKSQENAIKLADYLQTLSMVKKVFFVGLKTHPSYEISQRQSSGFGAMISFEVDCQATAHKLLNNVKIIQFAESLGGVETLITYPTTQTHADVPPADRAARGINDRLLRLSVGIENVDDLIEDLSQAIK